MRAGSLAGIAGLCVAALFGCTSSATTMGGRWQGIERYARPLLELDPNANWTACFNELAERRAASVEYLLARPEMNRRAAPDDLRVMLTTSLLRMLAESRTAPRLSVNCYETTLDLLYFQPKVLGRPLGEVCIPPEGMPNAWHALYPADFNHVLAQAIDVENDRRIMVLWWQTRGVETARQGAPSPLRPREAYLWDLLARRYADVWTYESRPAAFLCGEAPAAAVLLHGKTLDYNLVRAACIWLGSSEDAAVSDRLIGLVAHPSEIVSHNARFALRFRRDPRIRAVIERYNSADDVPTTEDMRVWSDVEPRSGLDVLEGS
jgi:hypothetical protein